MALATRRLVAALLVVAAARGAGAEPTKPADYRSPYRVEFTIPQDQLIPDILDGPRGDPKRQGRVPFDQWYSEATRQRWGAWGPPAVHHPVPDGLAGKTADWQRERVVAVGLRQIGVSYQYHHLPDWDPPADWPGLEVGRGHNARGIDCSNFTTFVYNRALGLKPNSAIGKQAELTRVPRADGTTVPVERIERPAEFAEFSKVLKTGDLLFIKNKAGRVSHVVLWVGPIGRAPAGVPLVLDSTGTGHRDSHGKPIPDGVQFRPFTPTSWYFKSASHALRLIP